MCGRYSHSDGMAAISDFLSEEKRILAALKPLLPLDGTARRQRRNCRLPLNHTLHRTMNRIALQNPIPDPLTPRSGTRQ